MSVWKRFDRGFLVVLAICFLAVWPFIKYQSLPNDTDAELHVLRLAELARMVQGGDLYPRWAANFYFGFGYPIFNYYAPLTYWLGLPLVLLGLSPVTATKLVFIGGIVGTGIGVYGFTRDIWGQKAGFVAAATTVFAPYIVFIDPLGRGVSPESFSFAIFALTLWKLNQLTNQPTKTTYILTVLGIFGVMTTHNLMAFVFGTMLFAWFVWDSVTNQRFEWKTLSTFFVGVGLAAFFWLPMLLEQDAIQIKTVIGSGSHYDFRNHFLSWRDLIASTPRFDHAAVSPFYNFNWGWPQLILASLGFSVFPFLPSDKRKPLAFFLLSWLLLTFLMLPLSQPLWSATPILPFLQFPWRLLGASAIVMGVLAGAGTSPLLGENRWLTPLIVVAVVSAGLSLTQVPAWGDFGATDETAVLVSETQGRWRGTASTADYVPSTVDTEPGPEQTVIDAILAGERPDRINRFTLGSAQVTATAVSPTKTLYETDSEEEFVLRLYQFMFPGWTATIDGRPQTIDLALPEGWMAITAPAGQHEVAVTFGSTPPRRIGWVISLFSLIAALVFASRITSTDSLSDTKVSAESESKWTASAVLALIALHLLVIEPRGWLYRAPDQPFTASRAETASQINFDDEIMLIGYDAPPLLEAGGRAEITLYWQAQRLMEDNYQVFVHLLPVEADGSVSPPIVQSDKINPADFPTEQWPLRKYVRDSHTIQLPDDLEGRYQLTTGVVLATENRRLRVIVPASDWFELEEYVIESESR